MFVAEGEQLPIAVYDSTKHFAKSQGINMDRAYNILAKWKTNCSKYKFKYGVERVWEGD